MSRFTRNTVILVKKETTYGVDPTPTGGANAVLVSNPSFKLTANNVNRDLVRPYFGASEQLVGTKYDEIGFDVEIVGGGTAGDAPAWGDLLKACAFAETLTSTIRGDYVPVTDGQDSATIYYYESGALKKALGARGKLTLSMKEGDIPKFTFGMVGTYGGISGATPSGIDFSAFQTPQVVTNANTVQMKLGATVNLDDLAPVITGGTAYPSLGLELDLGMTVPLTALVGGETVDVTDRQLTGKITLDLSAADEATFEGNVITNALTSLAFTHGTVAGKKVMIYLPRVQLTNPAADDLNGRHLVNYDITCPPSSAGNDEIHIITF